MHSLGADFIQKVFDHTVIVPSLTAGQVEGYLRVISNSADDVPESSAQEEDTQHREAETGSEGKEPQESQTGISTEVHEDKDEEKLTAEQGKEVEHGSEVLTLEDGKKGVGGAVAW